MTDHNYLSDPKNPFFSLEDDVDDETFLKNAPNNFSSPANINYNSSKYIEDKQQQLYQARKAIEQRTIQSSERSISLLRDSEEVGINTAEELIRQREQLEQTENRLDDINSTLRFSQKHIQGIKSVFGNLKNYLSGSNKTEPSSSIIVPSKISAEATSPDLSARVPNAFSSIVEEASNSRPYLQNQEVMEKPTNISTILERNLDEMSGSLARLKGLAIGLSSEIDTQNDLIDSITDKAERADSLLEKQNKDIRQLLKK